MEKENQMHLIWDSSSTWWHKTNSILHPTLVLMVLQNLPLQEKQTLRKGEDPLILKLEMDRIVMGKQTRKIKTSMRSIESLNRNLELKLNSSRWALCRGRCCLRYISLPYTMIQATPASPSIPSKKYWKYFDSNLVI